MRGVCEVELGQAEPAASGQADRISYLLGIFRIDQKTRICVALSGNLKKF